MTTTLDFAHPVRITIEDIEPDDPTNLVDMETYDGRTAVLQCASPRERGFIIHVLKQLMSLPQFADRRQGGQAARGRYFVDLPRLPLTWEELNTVFPDIQEGRKNFRDGKVVGVYKGVFKEG